LVAKATCLQAEGNSVGPEPARFARTRGLIHRCGFRATAAGCNDVIGNQFEEPEAESDWAQPRQLVCTAITTTVGWVVSWASLPSERFNGMRSAFTGSIGSGDRFDLMAALPCGSYASSASATRLP